jgi:hypothetical protein
MLIEVLHDGNSVVSLALMMELKMVAAEFRI